jgi:hypothetical protein
LPERRLNIVGRLFKNTLFLARRRRFYNESNTMTTMTLTLGAPSHAVEPALLAQRLPNLSAALRGFVSAAAISTPAPSAPSAVQVYAAQLGVQRDHVTLEALPPMPALNHETLVAVAASLVAEFAAEGLVFTAASGLNASNSSNALGSLNLQMALPPAANFIGRDIAKALPRADEARVLRQFVNGAQMALHQSPIPRSNVNSLWCSNPLPADALSQAWLQSGLTAWWDALPEWDSSWDKSCDRSWDKSYEASALNAATQLNLVFSDVTISVPLKRRATWALWSKPLDLAALLQSPHA